MEKKTIKEFFETFSNEEIEGNFDFADENITYIAAKCSGLERHKNCDFVCKIAENSSSNNIEYIKNIYWWAELLEL